jgi:beta-glucosidase
MPFTPLYRFVYGLSYTTYKYSDLATKLNDDGSVTVTASVENTGDRDGSEVAQLYVTDLLTSVITPVIELKGVQRLTLKKGEKRAVSFNLTPYQLSFLDGTMQRVIEPATFRVHVGGASPEAPTGGDGHKSKIGFHDPSQGVTGEFQIAQRFQADFACDLTAPAIAHPGETFPVTVSIKNQGNLLDVAAVKLYGDSLLDSHRFEIMPGESRTHTFTVSLDKTGTQTLTVILGNKAISHSIQISAPAASPRSPTPGHLAMR